MLKNSKKIYIGLSFLVILVMAFWIFLSYQKNSKMPGGVPFAFTEPQALSFPDNTCNIADFGAVSDGKTKNTQSFKKAIEACSQKGGGKVYVPEGQWLTGAIHLKSNINLNLNEKAEIIFSDNPDDYLPVVFTRFEGMELYNYSAFIYAKDAQNIAITGQGTLNGQEQFWQSWKTGEKKSIEKLADMIKKDAPTRERIFGFQDSGLRPSFIEFVDCQNIWLKDFFITSSPRWTIHPIYCENILMDNLRVETLGFNSDGIVIDSSKNVLIENCTLKTGDDTIAIKSGLEKDGWRVNRPSENIVICNTKIEEGHSGIAIGSEMSGGVKNVFLHNLRLDGIDQGICTKSTKSRGGYVENIWAKNISIGTATNVAIDINPNYNASAIKSDGEIAPVIKNFNISNVGVGKTKFAVRLDGLKNSLIKNIDISNLLAFSEKGVSVKNCDNVNFSKIKINGVKESPIFNISKSSNINY